MRVDQQGKLNLDEVMVKPLMDRTSQIYPCIMMTQGLPYLFEAVINLLKVPSTLASKYRSAP
uniref:Uncharacterized protein n=1 Tax=Picea glauca TaxID=3330 RepID=A0A101LWT0_PICGL|nr:hypothetical protein ABT39_MTgene1705 [Picea glauca]